MKSFAIVVVFLVGCGSNEVTPVDVGRDVGAAAGAAGGGAGGGSGGSAAGGAAGTAADAGVPPYDGGGVVCNQPAGSVWLADQCATPGPTGHYCRTNCRYADKTTGAILATASPPCVELGTADPRYPETCVAACAACP